MLMIFLSIQAQDFIEEALTYCGDHLTDDS